MEQKTKWLQKNKKLFLLSLGSGLLGWIGLILLSILYGEIPNFNAFLDIFQGDGLIISLTIFLSFSLGTLFLITLYHHTSGKIRILIFLTIISGSTVLIIPFIQYQHHDYQVKSKNKLFFSLKNDLKQAKNAVEISRIIAKVPNDKISYFDFGNAIGRSIICSKELSLLKQLEDKGYTFKKEYSIGTYATGLLRHAITNQCYHQEILGYLLNRSNPAEVEINRLVAKSIFEEENFQAFKQLIQYQNPLSEEWHAYFYEFYSYASVKTGNNKKRIENKHQKYVEYLSNHLPLNKNMVRDNSEVNPLYISIREGDAELVKILLDKGSNINQTYIKNIKDPKPKTITPLGVALYYRQIDVAEILIDAGADVNQVMFLGDEKYSNYLSYFLQKGFPQEPANRKLVDMLVKHTHTIDSKSKEILREI